MIPREPGAVILRGAKALASYLFGDEKHYKAIYPLAEELGLFTLGGLICGRTGTIDKALAAKERAPLADRLPMRHRPAPHTRGPRRKPSPKGE